MKIKKYIPFAILIIFFVGISEFYIPDSMIINYKTIDANNIRTDVSNFGSFDRNQNGLGAGFEWPKNSGKYAIYASGLWISCKVNDSIRVSNAEYQMFPYALIHPGYFDFENQVPMGRNDPLYRLYKVSPDFPNGNNDFDPWSVWPVSQGAPWVDVNGNGNYEPPADYPVMKGSQNLFCSMTDGYRDSASNFSPPTPPLRAEIHLYVWAIPNPSCADAIHYEWKIINKNISGWTEMSAAIWSDIDLGTSNNDLAGTDSTLNLLFGYNGNNNDPIYGAAPPAVGYVIKEASNHLNSSFKADFAIRWRCAFDCPIDSLEEYNVLHGLRADGSQWTNHLTNKSTRFPFSGNPVNHSGWLDSLPGERYGIIGSLLGNVPSLDTVIFQNVTLIKRGSDNLLSIQEVKNCVNSVIGIENNSNTIPQSFNLFQNYPNPFNPKTIIKIEIKQTEDVIMKVYDAAGREVVTLLSQRLNPGIYETTFEGNNLPSGIYFYTLYVENYSQTKKMMMIK